MCGKLIIISILKVTVNVKHIIQRFKSLLKIMINGKLNIVNVKTVTLSQWKKNETPIMTLNFTK